MAKGCGESGIVSTREIVTDEEAVGSAGQTSDQFAMIAATANNLCSHKEGTSPLAIRAIPCPVGSLKSIAGKFAS